MAEKSIKQFDEKNDERVYVSVRETLESARGKVERAVNSAMVEAYQRNLYQMQQFYLAFPKVHALRAQLSWTHYRRLMRIPDQGQREFYMNAAADERWTSRQLDHQIATLYRERLLSSQGELLR